MGKAGRMPGLCRWVGAWIESGYLATQRRGSRLGAAEVTTDVRNRDAYATGSDVALKLIQFIISRWGDDWR
jgi:hypothetical protein